MKKWVVGIVAVVLSAIFIISGKYAFSYLYNQKFISEYEDGNYDVSTNPLFFVNCFESYIAHYNAGNLSYKKEEYEDAIEEYKQALSYNPPEDKECSIRINLALAMVYGMGDDFDSPENIDASIATLEEARDVLLEKGCASDDGEGHNKTAQKLKEEIDELIERLKRVQQNSSGNPEEQQQPQPEPGGDGDEDQELMEQLQQNQAEAQEEREDNLEQNSVNLDYNWDSDYDGIW